MFAKGNKRTLRLLIQSGVAALFVLSMVGIFVAVGASSPPGGSGAIHSGFGRDEPTTGGYVGGNVNYPFNCGATVAANNLGQPDLAKELDNCAEPHYTASFTYVPYTTQSVSCFGTATDTIFFTHTTTPTFRNKKHIVSLAVPACIIETTSVTQGCSGTVTSATTHEVTSTHFVTSTVFHTVSLTQAAVIHAVTGTFVPCQTTTSTLNSTTVRTLTTLRSVTLFTTVHTASQGN